MADLCALADVRTQLELRTADTSRDSLINALIPHATALIQGDLEREFVTTTNGSTARTFPFNWDEANRKATVVVDLAPYDLQSASLVTLNPETSSPVTLVADTDYILEPRVQPDGVYTSVRLSRYLVNVSQLALRFGEPRIAITGIWGFAAVPADVKITAAQVVTSWLRRDVANLGMNLGELDNAPPTLPATFDLPLFAKRNLNRYRRSVGAF